MSTEAQINANRKNALNCTGPTTPEGKAQSSQNALKHGLDAKSEVIRCESRANFESLTADFYARFQPTLPEERGLVDMIIRAEWMVRRYSAIDASVWERGFLDTETTALGMVYIRNQHALDRVNRRINSAQRNYQSAMSQLIALRDKRGADHKPSLEIVEAPADPDTTESVSPKLVSFPSETPESDTPAMLTEMDTKPEDNPPIAA